MVTRPAKEKPMTRGALAMVTAQAIKFSGRKISHGEKGERAATVGVGASKISEAFLVLDLAPDLVATWPRASGR
jgi:hypothetical protein